MDGYRANAVAASQALQAAAAAGFVTRELARLLSPEWSIQWSPTTHRRFQRVDRRKCRLVLLANLRAARPAERESRAAQVLRWTGLRGWSGGEGRVAWTHLPAPVVQHILRLALFLW